MIFRENSIETVIAIKTVYLTSWGGGRGGGVSSNVDFI